MPTVSWRPLMQAWRVHRNGEPSEVMRLEETDRPTPSAGSGTSDGQVLLKVLAADINFPDVLLCVLPTGAAR
jgi:NADPH2:quinone reductase